MAAFSQARKAVGLIVTGIPVWGAAASAENGIDKSEWWGLVALLAAGFMVWWLPNDPAPTPTVTPTEFPLDPWVPPDLPAD